MSRYLIPVLFAKTELKCSTSGAPLVSHNCITVIRHFFQTASLQCRLKRCIVYVDRLYLCWRPSCCSLWWSKCIDDPVGRECLIYVRNGWYWITLKMPLAHFTINNTFKTSLVHKKSQGTSCLTWLALRVPHFCEVPKIVHLVRFGIQHF